MKISIAMATYNGEAYLQEQLDSLVNQTMQPNELIVTDDCSTDATLEVLKNFKKIAPFNVEIFQNSENLGYSRNFEKAIELCAGDVIFLCDQDDYWYPEKISSIVELYDKNENILVILNDALICNSTMKLSAGTLLGCIKSDDFVHGCCTSFRSKFKDMILPIPQNVLAHDNWAHDNWISFLGRKISVLYICPLVLQNYRRHQSTATKNELFESNIVVFFKNVINALNFKLFKLLATDPSEECKSRIYNLTLVKDGLLAIRSRTRCSPFADSYQNIDSYISELNSLIELNKSRLNARNMRFTNRAAKVFDNYKSGGYSQFSGLLSALKDIFYPMR